jgi:hypothetical protein
VPVDSPLINRAVAQRRDLYDQFGVILVGFEKHPRGKVEFSAALPETVFEVNCLDSTSDSAARRCKM